MIRSTLAVAVVFLCAAFSAVLAADAKRPNIVIILADDLGYGDVKAFYPDGKIPTPHMDRLAREGMMFTESHTTSGVCSPTRYSVLTGRYHWRSRLQAGIVGVFGDALIAKDRLTIAGVLKQQGYHTACIGKWHLGWEWSQELRASKPAERRKTNEPTDADKALWQRVFAEPIAGGPTARGFDSYFGTDVPNWPPYCFIENDRTRGIPSEFLPANLLTNHLASLPGPALPQWKLEDILPALADRASSHIEQRAKENAPFFLYLPLTAPHTPIAVAADWRGRSGLTAYADFVMQTDAVVGRVLDALDRTGAAANTLVFFTSDNGFAAYVGAPELEKQGHRPSGPFRGYKGDAWEGGHHVAFAARWPGVVRPGSRCAQLICHTDFMATCADVVGAKLPENAAEDSVSLLPLLRGEDKPIHEAVVHHSMSGKFAIRQGKWKLLLCAGSGGAWGGLTDAAAAKKELPPVQLYDMEADPGEKNNLEAKHPEEVQRLTALLEKLVADGRSTPGAPQKNDVAVDIFKRGAKAQPKKK